MTGPDDRGDSPKPVVESSPVPVDPTTHALHLRIRQQEILAELGVRALQGASFDELLNQTVRLTAEGMEAEFCKVLEYIREDKRFLVRAGVGWAEGIVGTATEQTWNLRLGLRCEPVGRLSPIISKMSSGSEHRSFSSNMAFAAP
jgi:hypothetical protein